MHILLIEIELYLPTCHSLKEKRGVIKPLLNAIRRDYNVSIAEVDAHDVWQSAVLAAVCIGNLKPALERTERELARVFDTHPEAQLSAIKAQWL